MSPAQVRDLVKDMACSDNVKLLGACEYKARFQTTDCPCTRRDSLRDRLIASGGAVLIVDEEGWEHWYTMDYVIAHGMPSEAKL